MGRDDHLGLLGVEAGRGETAFALRFRLRNRGIVVGGGDHHGLGFGVVRHQGVAFGAFLARIGGPLAGRFAPGFTG
ncbi:Uncharacterised protein [Mycobacterium tuberculosis]|uniref:Uncharacterized protein n=1 Tax=Mycobacterium tuberculosis TaxID=1773 RepID=A0A655FNC3_MYCTX|nr:Uncharacterised protein [Mycobacterium tuberculosis]CKT94242.1 Uncharacterised protein [Mycobacterium tuberculosis]CNV48082.1 Uncharacterised protein [Mycobacterium tuberculosis]CNV88297.1 Uncharacterised protein [Mycobacterium tuberculosis]CNW97165.1 Uncharacterised protein [Mycobacterium tuberculosis]